MLRAGVLAGVVAVAGCSQSVPSAPILSDAPPRVGQAAPLPRSVSADAGAPVSFGWTLVLIHEDDSKHATELSTGREVVPMTDGDWSCVVTAITHPDRAGANTETRELQCSAGDAEVATPVFCSAARTFGGGMLTLTRKGHATHQRVQLLCGSETR